ncbi:MAG: rhodanese-like domain-containing protein [Deltaproteobacteria bacterium]|nr:rhodanese-like domain-containing protein [Deltaproteobacteria bacterium]
MRTMLFTFVMALVVAPAASSCSKAEDATREEARPTGRTEVQVPTVSIDELDRLLAAGGQAVDANGAPTRKKLGVIPGAVLLSDFETFLPSELPADKAKPLVFYCANTHCGASHEAAARALTAGYTNVRVLPDGIAGWVKAGKQTAQI